MKVEDMQDAFQFLDDAYIEEVERLRKRKKQNHWTMVLPLAACFGLILFATQGKIPFLSAGDTQNESGVQENVGKVPTKESIEMMDGLENLTTEAVIQEETAETSWKDEYSINIKDDKLGRLSRFSYEEDQKSFSEQEGVIYEGFKNTEKIKVKNQKEAVRLAIVECTIEYDRIAVAYDKTANMWRVAFLGYSSDTESVAGGCQTVYINGIGITQAIVYGE